MMRRWCVYLFLFALVMPALAQEASDPAKGEKFFVAHCARCHGVGGTGGEGPPLTRTRFRHAADDEALAAIVRDGIEGTDMPGTWMLSDTDIGHVVAYVRSIGRVEEVALPGDRSRGKRLYEGRGGCTICHVVDGEGGVLGPDLTEVGARRGADYLREALLQPGAAVAPTYLVVKAVTADGGEITGLRVNEDSFTIQLRDERGQFHSLDKLRLRELDKRFGESLMPSYRSELSQSEIDDVVAYLASLRGEL